MNSYLVEQSGVEVQLDHQLVQLDLRKLQSIRLCKWLKQLDSKLSPVKGFMGSNPLSVAIE